MIVELNREEALNIMMSGYGVELDEAEKFLSYGNRYFYNETGKFIYVLRNDYWRRRDKINEETD